MQRWRIYKRVNSGFSKDEENKKVNSELFGIEFVSFIYKN